MKEHDGFAPELPVGTIINDNGQKHEVANIEDCLKPCGGCEYHNVRFRGCPHYKGDLCCYKWDHVIYKRREDLEEKRNG